MFARAETNDFGPAGENICVTVKSVLQFAASLVPGGKHITAVRCFKFHYIIAGKKVCELVVPCFICERCADDVVGCRISQVYNDIWNA